MTFGKTSCRGSMGGGDSKGRCATFHILTHPQVASNAIVQMGKGRAVQGTTRPCTCRTGTLPVLSPLSASENPLELGRAKCPSYIRVWALLRVVRLVGLGFFTLRTSWAAFPFGTTWTTAGASATEAFLHPLAELVLRHFAVLVGVQRVKVLAHPLGSFFLRQRSVAVLVELLPEVPWIAKASSIGTITFRTRTVTFRARTFPIGTWSVSLAAWCRTITFAHPLAVRTGPEVSIRTRSTAIGSHLASAGPTRSTHQLTGVE